MANGHEGTDRRKEIRYPVEARVLVRKKSGEIVHATAVDISSSGMRLRLMEPPQLAIGEEITVEVELPDYPDRSFSSWGVGRIAYIDADGAGIGVGIQLSGGQFDPAPPGERP